MCACCSYLSVVSDTDAVRHYYRCVELSGPARRHASQDGDCDALTAVVAVGEHNHAAPVTVARTRKSGAVVFGVAFCAAMSRRSDGMWCVALARAVVVEPSQVTGKRTRRRVSASVDDADVVKVADERVIVAHAGAVEGRSPSVQLARVARHDCDRVVATSDATVAAVHAHVDDRLVMIMRAIYAIEEGTT